MVGGRLICEAGARWRLGAGPEKDLPRLAHISTRAPYGPVRLGARQELFNIASLDQGGLQAAPEAVPARAPQAQDDLRSREVVTWVGRRGAVSGGGGFGVRQQQQQEKAESCASTPRQTLALSSLSCACAPGSAASWAQMRRKWEASSSTASSSSPSASTPPPCAVVLPSCCRLGGWRVGQSAAGLASRLACFRLRLLCWRCCSQRTRTVMVAPRPRSGGAKRARCRRLVCTCVAKCAAPGCLRRTTGRLVTRPRCSRTCVWGGGERRGEDTQPGASRRGSHSAVHAFSHSFNSLPSAASARLHNVETSCGPLPRFAAACSSSTPVSMQRAGTHKKHNPKHAPSLYRKSCAPRCPSLGTGRSAARRAAPRPRSRPARGAAGRARGGRTAGW